MESSETRSALKSVLVPLIKLALAPEASAAPQWHRDLETAYDVLRHVLPDGLADLAKVWPAAITLAERDPAVRREETVNPTLPLVCPVAAADFLGPLPDWNALAATIRDNASFG